MSDFSRVLYNGENQITQSYQSHYNKVASGNGWAIGVDLVKKNMQCEYIVAHTDGKVIKVVNYLNGTNGVMDKEGFGYGNYVMIEHKNKVVTTYAHLANVQGSIKEGTNITKGTIIGFMGNTGNSFGAHLHFEVRLYKTNITNITLQDKTQFEFLNPENYLNNDLPYQSNSSVVVGDRYIVYVGDKRNSSYNNLKYAKAQADKVGGYVYDTVIKQKIYNGAKKLTSTSYPNYTNGGVYRVRKSFNDVKTAKGAFSTWVYAYNCYVTYAPQGYNIYDNEGNKLN